MKNIIHISLNGKNYRQILSTSSLSGKLHFRIIPKADLRLLRSCILAEIPGNLYLKCYAPRIWKARRIQFCGLSSCFPPILAVFVLSPTEPCTAMDSPAALRILRTADGKKTPWETNNVTSRNYPTVNVTNIVIKLRLGEES